MHVRGNSAPAPSAGRAERGLEVSTAHVIDDADALSLWGRAQTAAVFNHPAWWRNALAAFGEGRRLIIVRVSCGTQTVALWPLWLKRLGPREGFTRILEPIGARVTDYCMPLIAAGYDQAFILELLLREAASQLDPQTLLLWPKVPLAQSECVALEDAAIRTTGLVRSLHRPCPAMSLPETYEQLEKRWSKSHRGDVRRQIKRLNSVGRLELVMLNRRDQIEGMLPKLYAMHTANWRARSGYSELENGPMTTFVARLAAELPETLISASELRIDGITISSHFGFQQNRTILWYKPTYDVAWANYAPGKVHVALAAQAGITAGMEKIDFMQGTEPYKLLWSDLTTSTKSFVIARPIAYPLWAWNTTVRNFAAEYRY